MLPLRFVLFVPSFNNVFNVNKKMRSTYSQELSHTEKSKKSGAGSEDTKYLRAGTEMVCYKTYCISKKEPSSNLASALRLLFITAVLHMTDWVADSFNMGVFTRSMYNSQYHSILPRYCSFVCKIMFVSISHNLCLPRTMVTSNMTYIR
jgi:hypothetical protein